MQRGKPRVILTWPSPGERETDACCSDPRRFGYCATRQYGGSGGAFKVASIERQSAIRRHNHLLSEGTIKTQKQIRRDAEKTLKRREPPPLPQGTIERRGEEERRASCLICDANAGWSHVDGPRRKEFSA